MPQCQSWSKQNGIITWGFWQTVQWKFVSNFYSEQFSQDTAKDTWATFRLFSGAIVNAKSLR